MSFENVKQFFAQAGADDKILTFEQSSATVEEAAEDVGCEPKQIAKTMAFYVDGHPIVIVMAGDARTDNRRFKDTFHQKAKMIPTEQVEEAVGHAPGGVCPFAVRPGVAVYLDESLKRFDFVYPAAGSDHSAVKLTIPELEKFSSCREWVDVTRGWQEETRRRNGIVVFGAAFMDIKGYPLSQMIPDGRNAGRVLQTHGGVSRYRKFAWFFSEVLGREITPEESEEWGKRFAAYSLEEVKRCPLIPGVEKALTDWEGKLPMCVCSGSPTEELRSILDLRKLSHFFRLILGSPPAKAQVLANIVREMKLDPADVLMVGDASTDRDAAEEVGTQFYGRGPALKNDGTFPWEENLDGLSSWIGSHVR